MMANPRLTTGEVANRLGCEAAEALVLLKVAGITFSRLTEHGAYLWDAAAVERLLSVIRSPEGEKA